MKTKESLNDTLNDLLKYPEPVDAVALCKAGVIKYTPLGAYPGGSDEVKAALTYCNSLG